MDGNHNINHFTTDVGTGGYGFGGDHNDWDVLPAQ